MGSLAFYLGHSQNHSAASASVPFHAEDEPLASGEMGPGEVSAHSGSADAPRPGSTEGSPSSGSADHGNGGPVASLGLPGLLPAQEIAPQIPSMLGANTLHAMAWQKRSMTHHGSGSGGTGGLPAAGKSAQASAKSGAHDPKAAEEHEQVAFVPERVHHRYLQLVYREHLSEYEYEWLERWLD